MINMDRKIVRILTSLCLVIFVMIGITVKVSYSTPDNIDDYNEWNVSFTDFDSKDVRVSNNKFYFHTSLSIEQYDDSFSFYVNNYGDYEAYIKNIYLDHLTSDEVGTYNGVKYCTSDFINFKLYYDEDREHPVNMDDILSANTFKQIFVVLELKPSYELSSDELALLEQVGTIELDLSVKIDYQQSM